MRVDVLSLFPAMVEAALGDSIPRIARDKGALELHAHDIRRWSTNKHGKVDDRPFGGGPGMVLCCQPVVDAVAAVTAMDPRPARLLFTAPEGRRLDQPYVKELAAAERLIIVCGRYEGFDQRIFDLLDPERVSLGDFILSGGEIAATAIVDAVTRLLPGVLGCGDSAERESFSERLLDHPHYTQPPVFRGLAVPDVLREGHHRNIDAWRHEQALALTRRFRPDLLE